MIRPSPDSFERLFPAGLDLRWIQGPEICICDIPRARKVVNDDLQSSELVVIERPMVTVDPTSGSTRWNDVDDILG